MLLSPRTGDPGTRVSGATRWLTSDKAMIQLSLRYKSNDHLWFTFFHEAGHILLHGKREVFLEEGTSGDGKEKEADRFASNVLIPAVEYQAFVDRASRNQGEIRRFAERSRSRRKRGRIREILA